MWLIQRSRQWGLETSQVFEAFVIVVVGTLICVVLRLRAWRVEHHYNNFGGLERR